MDRNSDKDADWVRVYVSLSARRAWIEMFLSMGLDGRFKVALRKESVDRNARLLMCFWPFGLSLSARRAWIEMTQWRL